MPTAMTTTSIVVTFDRAIDAQRLVGVNDGDMRCAEEIVILHCLPGIGRPVTARDAERVVELEAAFAAALQIDAEIFARKRKVAVCRRAGAHPGKREPP